MPEPEQQRLRQMLEQLHSELQRAPAADDRSRELLERALSDIRNLLDAKHPEKRAESIVDRLRELVSTFEETHPALTEAIGRVVDALVTMGI
jgi:chromosome segregation ATPase